MNTYAKYVPNDVPKYAVHVINVQNCVLIANFNVTNLRIWKYDYNHNGCEHGNTEKPDIISIATLAYHILSIQLEVE